MCGIAGFYKHNMQVMSPFTMDDANNIQRHRGPDFASGICLHDGKVSLFHQRLSILDLTRDGNQPMSVCCNSCAKGVWMVYNGEIYNYHELKVRLIQRGHTFNSQSDSEVIIHLYAEYGLKAFLMLNGIFSIALFDGRERRTKNSDIEKNDVIIVRDQLGVKPLYYSNNESYFSFASELKTLLLDVNLSRELDYISLNDYLTYLWCPAPRTMLKYVKKLEPGNLMIIRNGRIVNKQQYYTIPIKKSHDKLLLSEQEAVEKARFYLQQAVSRQMVADVPIGAFLSGGLDSSAIVALMKEVNITQKIDCYTIGFKATKHSEGFVADLPYAQKVAKHLDVPLNTVWVGDDMYKHIPKMLYHLDEPQADPAPINAMLIARMAQDQGYKVLMSGAGGDDIFSGYRRHYALGVGLKLNKLPMEFRSLIASAARGVARGCLGSANKTFMRRLTKLLSDCDVSGDARIASYFCWNHAKMRESLLTESALAQIGKIENYEDITHHLKPLLGAYDDLDKMLLLECKHFLSDHNLNYTDKVTMAHGIETRVPLLDLDLVDFCYQLPVEFKQRGKVGKYLFKKAMEGYLPHDVIYRPKTGFGAPLRDWIHKGMAPAINEILSKKNVLNRGIFSYDAMIKLIDLDKKNYVDASYTIFALFCIELWCQTFIDNEIPAPINLW